MKVKTNVRAGAGTQKQNGKGGTSTDSSSSSSPDYVAPVVYYPPVSRCVGI